MVGFSSRHGGHQVAQKFITTTWPRKSDSEILSPSILSRVNSGACSPTTTDAGGGPPGQPDNKSKPVTTSTRADIFFNNTIIPYFCYKLDSFSWTRALSLVSGLWRCNVLCHRSDADKVITRFIPHKTYRKLNIRL